MRITWVLTVAAAAALAGCAQPDASTPYGRYLLAREAALQGQGAVPDVIPVVLPQAAPTPEQIAPAPRRVRTAAPAPAGTSAVPAPISRPARQAATGYGRTQTVLEGYAAAVDNDPGEARFARNLDASDSSRACAAWPTPEAAQIAFIARGGPQADPLGLDPDGDGFVCGWDPRPLRQGAR